MLLLNVDNKLHFIKSQKSVIFKMEGLPQIMCKWRSERYGHGLFKSMNLIFAWRGWRKWRKTYCRQQIGYVCPVAESVTSASLYLQLIHVISKIFFHVCNSTGFVTCLQEQWSLVMETARIGPSRWSDRHTAIGVRTRGSYSRHGVQDQNHGYPAGPT